MESFYSNLEVMEKEILNSINQEELQLIQMEIFSLLILKIIEYQCLIQMEIISNQLDQKEVMMDN